VSDAHLNAAKMHLSEASAVAGDLASAFQMKRLTRALNRCNPIDRHPPQPPAPYGENPFEGGNVGTPPQSPQYSVGSYPEGRAIEANFAAPPDPCAGMRETLAACGGPQMYVTDSSGHEHKESGPGGGQFTSGSGSGGSSDNGKGQGSSASTPHTGDSSGSVDSQIEAINQRIMQIVNDGKGNSAKVVKARMKIIAPLVKEQDRLKMLKDPKSPMAIAASSKLTPAGDGGFDVSHDGKPIGRLVKERYTGFKTVNGANQITQKEGWVVLDPEGNRVATRVEKRADAIDMLAARHSKSLQSPTQNSRYEAASPLPRVEYPGDTIPPALPRDVMTDPCAGMREALASCRPPSPYCPSFMGQPTGEIPPLAGQPQPLDTYDSFAERPGPIDPSSSLNDTLRQLWLRQHLQERTAANQMPYSYPKNPDGRIQGPMNAVPEGDFLGGRFGPGIRRMRESLAACRR